MDDFVNPLMIAIMYGSIISGSTLVLGGLMSSIKQIWPRRKEVEESKEFSEVIHEWKWSKAWIFDVICGLHWRKMQMYVG
jgi:hypothetical protein